MRAESDGNASALGDTSLINPAYGAFQVRLPAFRDVQRIFPQEFGQTAFESVQANPEMNRLVARRYLEAGEQAYGIRDLDRLISFYNAGPRARKGALINGSYVEKVRRYMKQRRRN